MQKFSAYSLALVLSVAFSSTIYSSTVWKYNYSIVANYVKKAINERFATENQNADMEFEIEVFKNGKTEDIVKIVEREHDKKPFKTQQDAEDFALKVAKSESNLFFKNLIRDRVNAKLATFPGDLNYRDQIAAAAKTFVEDQAMREANKTGRLAESMRNLDGLIEQSLRRNLNWTCEVCSWLNS